MLLKPARKIAAAATVALAASAVAAVAPASAASGALKYDCKDPLGTNRVFTVTVDTDAPASITLGQSFTPKVTATVSVDDDTRGLLTTVGATSIEGATTPAGVSTSINYSVAGAAATAPATVPSTVVDATKPLVVTATAPGAAVTPAAVGSVDIVAGNFTAVLTGKTGTGDATPLSPYTIPCTLQAGQNLLIDTVQVTAATQPAPAKVDSKTTVKAKFTKAKKTITGTVKVVGTDAKPGTGTAKVTLKLGKKTIKSINAKLSATGAATAVFKKISKKGKYTVEVAYAGSATQNASTAKTTVKVK